MKHIQPVSKAPCLASDDVPVSVVIVFVQDVLTAILNLFIAKETVGDPTGGGGGAR